MTRVGFTTSYQECLKVFVLIFLGICNLIAMSIYTAKTRSIVEDGLFKYGWSFVLGWVCIFLTGSSGLFIILRDVQLPPFLKWNPETRYIYHKMIYYMGSFLQYQIFVKGQVSSF